MLPAATLAMSGGSARSEPGATHLPRSCRNGRATVVGADDADFADICSGVADARKSLALHGVRPTEPVSIEVTTNIPQEADATATGCCIELKRRAFVVPYQVFRKNKTWFGIGINREMFRMLAAHEAAHALAACDFRIPQPAIQAKESLAHVAMVSAMSPELRAKALRRTKTEGFASFDRFTPLLYMFDPMRFGAEAYLHCSSVVDRTALIHDVLAGNVLVD